MPIEFIQTEEAVIEEDSATIHKRTCILLSEAQQVVGRLSEIDLQMMAQDFSICIGWGRIKVCLTVEQA